jgi:hypothetical protein
LKASTLFRKRLKGEETKMSKIDELIVQYCRDGVEFKKLGEVLDYEQPNKYNGLIIELQQTGESLSLNVINDLKTNEQIPPVRRNNNAQSMNEQIPPFSRNDSSPCGEMREGSGGFAFTSFSSIFYNGAVIPNGTKCSEKSPFSCQPPVIPSEARNLSTCDNGVISNETQCSEETVTKKIKNE